LRFSCFFSLLKGKSEKVKKKMSWTDYNKPATGKHLLVSGRAYPRVQAGKNKTDIVTSDMSDRNAWYYDEAIMLSDADLNEYNGGKGLPLCVEHNVNDVVGEVRYGFLGDGEKRSLKIWARLPTGGSAHQQDVIDKIKSGYYKGLSVGYQIIPAHVSASGSGGARVGKKKFVEISLVKDPFFEGCDLSWNVTASKEGIKNSDYKSKNQDRLALSFEIDDMSEVSQQNQNQNQAQGQAPQQGESNGTGSSSTPSASAGKSSVHAEEILHEAEKLNTRLDTERKNSEAVNAKLAQMEKELSYHRAKEAKEAEEYKASQLPKFQKWLEIEEADKPLPEGMKAGYEQAWTDIRFKDNANKLEEQMNRVITLQASAKAAEERAKKLEEEKQALEQTVQASASAVKSLSARSNVANTLSNSRNATDEEKDIPQVQASGANLSQIMVKGPSDAELPFLQSYGYSSEINVNASAHDRFGGQREFVRSIKAAPRSHQDRDDHGHLNFPASARNIPGCDALFHWMCNNDDLRRGDLSEIVSINASRNRVERKDAEEWERKNLARMTQPQ
jgi:phage head maturation protease